MSSASRLTALNKFRNTSVGLRQAATKVLVIYEVQLKGNEVPHVPLVINYGKLFFSVYSGSMLNRHTVDLPKAVEEYSHRLVLPTSR